MNNTPKAPLRPVIAESGCLGHILFSARGYRAFDRHDRELGIFANAGDAAAAILEAPKQS